MLMFVPLEKMIALRISDCQPPTHNIWCPHFIPNTIGCVFKITPEGQAIETIGQKHFFCVDSAFSVHGLSTAPQLPAKKAE